MSKRFQKTRIVDKWGGIYDSETDRVLGVNDVEHELNEQQSTITELAKKWRVLSQENMQLKDYIDTIFEDNTHICKYLDVEDVQFYCDKNTNYRNPSCLYEKCFDEENLIKIKDEIRRVLE